MAELGTPTNNAADAPDAKGGPGAGRSKDEVALELMKFIAVSTGLREVGTDGGGVFARKPEPVAGRTRRRSTGTLRSLPESGR